MPKGPSPSLAYVPEGADHHELVRAAAGCRACALYARATQVVFGDGPTPAPILFVGEQPGDQEDKQGLPFVGPAGRVLDAALDEADVPRDQVYVTNAVKHFKWEPRGKRRLHARPNAVELHACRGWLEAEIRLRRPALAQAPGRGAPRSCALRARRSTTRNLVGYRRSVPSGSSPRFDPTAPNAPEVEAAYRAGCSTLKLLP